MKKILLSGIAGMMILLAGCNAGGTSNKTAASNAASSVSGEIGMGTGQGLDTMKKIPEFTAKTLDGEEVSSEIFKKSKVTLVNVWGSWCHPCVEELPELQKAYEKMKDQGVNVLGVIVHNDSDDADAEKDIIQKGGIKYTNIMPKGKLKEAVMNNQQFPLTLFVDSEGNVIGEPFRGGAEEAEFIKGMEAALAKTK